MGEAGLSVAAVPGLEKGRTGEGRCLSGEGEDPGFKARKKKNFCVSSCGKVVAVYGWLSTVLPVLSSERNDFLCQAEHDLFNHTYPRCTLS